MRRPTFFAILAFTVLGFTLFSVPAQADPILPDPVIGVLGGGGDSPPITDGSAQALTNDGCGDYFGSSFSSFFCAPYEFISAVEYGPAISSLDLAFWDADGIGILISAGFFPSDSSRFSGIVSTGNPYVLTLFARFGCDDDDDDDDDVCPEESPIFLGPPDVLIFAESTDDFPFFGGFVSIQAVNGDSSSQTAVATPGERLDLTSVPEPATLVLLATGMLGASFGGRLRRRR